MTTSSDNEQRIAMRPSAKRGAYVDGVWWPHSLDLVAELPALLTAVETAGYGEIRRVSYALTAWDGRPPPQATMLNRVIKLGGFRAQDPTEISLVDSSGWKRVTIVIVPPDAEPAFARRALATGLDDLGHRPHDLLEQAQGAA